MMNQFSHLDKFNLNLLLQLSLIFFQNLAHLLYNSLFFSLKDIKVLKTYYQ